MGRILRYKIATKTQYDEYIKAEQLNDTLSRPADAHKGGNNCGKCDYCLTDKLLNEWYNSFNEDFNHQKRFHDLPYSGAFTKEELKELANGYLKEDKYYELSVICILLDELNNSEESEESICVYHYD